MCPFNICPINELKIATIFPNNQGNSVPGGKCSHIMRPGDPTGFIGNPILLIYARFSNDNWDSTIQKMPF